MKKWETVGTCTSSLHHPPPPQPPLPPPPYRGGGGGKGLTRSGHGDRAALVECSIILVL